MRIIGGESRGRRLKTPENASVRPTSDRVRESVFNIIAPSVVDARVLDLFGGSGAMALEAMSRGARTATIVDIDKRSIQTIRANVNLTGFGSGVDVRRQDATRAIHAFINHGVTFDIIFLDPPYDAGWNERLFPPVSEILESDGLIIYEQDVKEDMPSETAKIENVRTVRYGDTRVSFWSKRSETHDGY